LTEVSSNGSDLGVDADLGDDEVAGVLDGDNAYGNYDPAQDISTQLPYTVAGASSLVAARKKDEERDGGCGTAAIVGACIDVYNIVSVLDTVPRNAGKNCIRPPIVEGVPKVPKCLDTDFVLERLPASPHLEATSDGLASTAATWRHAVEFFSNISEGGRAFRVEGLTDDYASGNAAAFYGSVARVFSDDQSLEAKRAALGSLLAYGQDYYVAFVDPAGPQNHIPAGAGQSSGHAASAYFYTTLLVDPLPASRLAEMALTPDADSRPQELKQVQQRGGGTEPVWGDNMGSDVANAARYWAGVFGRQCYDGAAGPCDPNEGKKTVRDPYGYIDGPETHPCAAYFGVTKGPYQAFAAVQWTMPEFCDVVNYDPFIRYVDRIFEQGCWTQPDPCAPPDPREDLASCTPWEAQTSDPSEWLSKSGCEYYTVTWGPDPTDLSRCIPNNTGGNTGQNGRFPEYHGTGIDGGVFWTPSIRAAWSELRGSGSTCRTHGSDAALEGFGAEMQPAQGRILLTPPHYSDSSALKEHNTVYEVVRQSTGSTVRTVQRCVQVDITGDATGTGYTLRACDHSGSCSEPITL
ncbi:MAG: hypothetical protein CVU63_01135, partial [Deltaproteobacteria bacterium HGW-Deltaproteobacteria-20]